MKFTESDIKEVSRQKRWTTRNYVYGFYPEIEVMVVQLPDYKFLIFENDHTEDLYTYRLTENNKTGRSYKYLPAVFKKWSK